MLKLHPVRRPQVKITLKQQETKGKWDFKT